LEASEHVLHVQRANKKHKYIIIKYLKVHQYIYVLKQSAIASFVSEKEPMGLPQIYKYLCPENMNMIIKKHLPSEQRVHF
jgi:hypothetical protein